MAAEFDVRAQLVLDSRGYHLGMQRAGAEAAKTDARLRKVEGASNRAGHGMGNAGHGAGKLKSSLQSLGGAAGGAYRQMLALGATYLGLNLASRAIHGISEGVFGYTASLEKAQIGLAGIISGVDGVGFEHAEATAKRVFDRLTELSVASPSTPQEMLGIFTGIVGPIRSAGFEMSKVLDMTQRTTLAAASLGIDFPQAARDIGMMARGTAGMDVKLFSLMRSMGAITESTEEWNTKLTAKERIDKLDDALKKFATPEKAKAFERSWTGRISTFTGAIQEMSRSWAEPIMGAGANALGRVNDYLIENRKELQAVLGTWGFGLARTLDGATDRAIDGARYVVQHWGEINTQIDRAVARLERMAPALKAAGIAMAIHGLAPGGVGALYGLGMAGAGEIVSRVPVGGQKPQGDWEKTAEAKGWKRDNDGRWRGDGGRFVPTAALAAAGMGSQGAPLAGMAASAASIGLLSGAVVIAGSAAYAAYQHWDVLGPVVQNATAGAVDSVTALGMVLGGNLLTSADLVGQVVLGALTPGMQLLAGTGKHAADEFAIFTDNLAAGAAVINGLVTPAFEWFIETAGGMQATVDALGSAIFDLLVPFGSFISMVNSFSNLLRDKPAGSGDAERPVDTFEPMAMPHFLEAKAERQTPTNRASTVVNNNFQGSHITVKQNFDKDKDPDRVLHAMIRDITKQSTRRVSSPYSPAITR